MPHLDLNDTRLYYEEHGEGFPILLFAPGGLRSAIAIWRTAEFDPIETLSPHFRVIAMDQRNAGQSVAPISADDGWHTYLADHVALLDYLGIDQCHLMGGCIGGPYAMGVIGAGPERVASAVLQQSIGYDDNREVFYGLFDGWADQLRASRVNVSDADWAQFRSNMFDGDFMFNIDRDFVRGVETPLLVLMGNDEFHPQVTSREIAKLAPNAELVERWKEPDVIGSTPARVLDFLQRHTPG